MISLIIPTLNAGRRLEKLLEALESQTARPEEIIVVDSASDDFDGRGGPRRTYHFDRARLVRPRREEPSCPRCGSTVRMRSIIHTLSMELFGKSMPIKDFPDERNITEVGISDWQGYAGPLSRKLD